MSKPTIHVGLACVTDKPWTQMSEGNLLRVSAVIQGNTFDQNLAPTKDFSPEVPKFYAKSPQIWDASTRSQIPLREGLEKFLFWLQSFRSTLVAVATLEDFFWLNTTMVREVGRCPFGGKLLDVGTWVAAKQNDPRLSRKWSHKFTLLEDTQESLDPVVLAQRRVYAVTQGLQREMPVARVGKKTVAPPTTLRRRVQNPPQLGTYNPTIGLPTTQPIATWTNFLTQDTITQEQEATARANVHLEVQRFHNVFTTLFPPIPGGPTQNG